MSVAKHTVYNLAGSVIPIAVSVVTVPLYLKSIGLDRYGVLAICWLLVGYFNLFDFGLGKATSQKLATMARSTSLERSRIFWTSALLSASLSLIAVLVFVAIAPTALGSIKLADPTLRKEVSGALPFLILAVPFGVMQSLLVGTLEGRREFLRINLILGIGAITTSVLPLLAALYVSRELPLLLATSLIGRAVMLVALAVSCVRAVKLHRPQLAERTHIKELLRFGGWTTVSNIVGPILVFIDRFAIGAVLTAAALALYVAPFNLVSQLTVLPAALSSALLPRLAGEKMSNEAASLTLEASRLLAFMITPATIVMAIGAGWFLQLWLGAANGQTAREPALVLLAGFWINSLARMPFVKLQASGRPDLIAKLHVAEIIPYFVLLYFFMKAFGLVGAAVAWSLRCSVDAVVMHRLARYDRATILILVTHGFLVASAVALAFLWPLVGPLRWPLAAFVGIMTAVVMLRSPPRQLDEMLAIPLSRLQSR
ncbi:MAG: oligosaccharide flippase family protein [Sphingomonas sp.]|uniref:oligosaccharide flippase family protein n=1 Tax=Sphingomonas sp. TaxID=28214 RepID=UPI0017A4968D|nr:oligosaccharide flippase family protein [Sphingomonas sp.]MBA3666272.1 oligosaccharide flippase family protein [Sphingomonas sp.]